MKMTDFKKFGIILCFISIALSENCSKNNSDCVNIPSTDFYASSQKCSKSKQLSKDDLNLLLISSIGPTVEWTKLASPTFTARYGINLAVLNNTIYMSGNYNLSWSTFVNDVWASTDGKTWTQKTSTPEYGNSSYTQMISFAGQLWVFNLWSLGSDGGVWSSSNGVNWTKKSSVFTPSTRSDYCLVADAGAMYLIGGYNNYLYYNDIWKSSNGVSWSKIGTGSFSTRGHHTCVYYNKTFFLMGGYGSNSTSTYSGEVWTSTNAITWTKKNGNKDFYSSSPNLFVNNALYEISNNPVKIYKTKDGDSFSTINTTGMNITNQSSGSSSTYTSDITPIILGTKLIAVTTTTTNNYSSSSLPTYSHETYSLELSTLPQ